jgi:hypothetical protein
VPSGSGEKRHVRKGVAMADLIVIGYLHEAAAEAARTKRASSPRI